MIAKKRLAPRMLSGLAALLLVMTLVLGLPSKAAQAGPGNTYYTYYDTPRTLLGRSFECTGVYFSDIYYYRYEHHRVTWDGRTDTILFDNLEYVGYSTSYGPFNGVRC